MIAALHATAMLAELCGLFAVWNWSCRSAGAGWLLSGGAILVLLFATAFLLPDIGGPRLFLAFAGMYVVSGLLWAWRFTHLHPADWNGVEVIVGLLAAVTIGAASAPVQP